MGLNIASELGLYSGFVFYVVFDRSPAEHIWIASLLEGLWSNAFVIILKNSIVWLLLVLLLGNGPLGE